jgi:hypothetical protein
MTMISCRIKTLTLSLIISLVVISSALSEEKPAAEINADPASSTPPPATRTRSSFIRLADFYLRDGSLISGKLITEDKDKIVIEKLDGSQLLVETYSRRQIDTRTIHLKSVLEYKYYLDLAEHFKSRTWDLKDDPEDFIQAIRAFATAKELMGINPKMYAEKIQEMDVRIEELQKQRDLWIKETESLAKLRKLEFDATIDRKIEEFEYALADNSEKITETLQRMEEIAKENKESYQYFEKALTQMDRSFTRQLNVLAERIEYNRELFYHYRSYSPYYYSRPKTNSDSDDED